MCSNIHYIYTRSKVISPFYSDRLILPVKCGVCSECLQQKQIETMLRIYYEWQDCANNGNFILFDTLTYSDEHLPHISDTVPDIDSNVDFPCFSREDLRLFFVRLRRALSKRGFHRDAFRYYVASEYGADDRYTHRPHYHVLFFVYNYELTPELFKQLVDKSWYGGRTDKLRKYGYHSNLFTGLDIKSALSVSHYVSLYVQKTNDFDQQVKKRIASVLRSRFLDNIPYRAIPKTFDFKTGLPCVCKFEDDDNLEMMFSFKELRNKLVRACLPFRLLSNEFGCYALRDVDLNQIIKDGFLTLPDQKQIVRRVSLPKYYERKLFEQKVAFQNKMFVWIPTEIGRRWRSSKLLRCFDNLIDKFNAANNVLQYDVQSLVRYVVYQHGRLIAPLGDSDITMRLSMPNYLFLYSTPTDIRCIGQPIISTFYLGNANDSYRYLPGFGVAKDIPVMPLSDFVRQRCYFDNDKFTKVNQLLHVLHSKAAAKDRLLCNLAELRNKYKALKFC